MTTRALVRENLALGEPGAGRRIHLLSLEAPALAEAARPGQFLMLRVAPGPDPLLARPFSIHGVADGQVQVLFQVMGRGTGLLSQAEAGASLELWGPLGHGFDLDLQRPLLVAGGMGIAPLAFAAAQLGRQGIETQLCWGLPGRAGFAGAVDRVGQGLEGQEAYLSLASEDGTLGSEGLVTDLLPGLLPACDGVLACGPLAMLREVARLCQEARVRAQVSLEAPMACGLGACLGCVQPAAGGGYVQVCQDGPVLEAGEIDWERI